MKDAERENSSGKGMGCSIMFCFLSNNITMHVYN